MSRLVLEVDSPERIVLEEPRAGALLLSALFALAATGVYWLLPGMRIAQGVLGLFVLVSLALALRRHRLTLDIEAKTFHYHRGWLFSPPLRHGSFEEIVGVFIDRNEALDGLEISRLRSRQINMELRDRGDGEVFPLGFPMGPRLAAEKAADYARRLGTEMIDRTTSTDPDGAGRIEQSIACIDDCGSAGESLRGRAPRGASPGNGCVRRGERSERSARCR